MRDFEKLCDFNNLYKAHLKARRGKQGSCEVTEFEMNLASNLTGLSRSIADGSYQISGFDRFI